MEQIRCVADELYRTEYVMVVECHYSDPPHQHVFPEDWIFGGANGLHPGADPRWKPTTYTYRDAMLNLVHVTQTPLCDEQALYEFTKIRDCGTDYYPVYLEIQPPGELAFLAKWRYNRHTDTLEPIKEGGGSDGMEAREQSG